MNVGFTGTRELTSPTDDWFVAAIVAQLILLHGDDLERIITGGCVGADAMIADVAYRNGLHVHTIIPANMSQVDPWVYTRCTSYQLMPRQSTYKDRNQAIVDQSDMLIGIPKDTEQYDFRSGTWQTIRMGKAKGIPVVVYTQKLARTAFDELSRD